MADLPEAAGPPDRGRLHVLGVHIPDADDVERRWWKVMDAPEQGRTEHDRQPTVELDRLSASGNRLDTGAACTVLVVHRVDGWSIHGLTLPGQGIHLSDDSMIILAQAILARARLSRPPEEPPGLLPWGPGRAALPNTITGRHSG